MKKILQNNKIRAGLLFVCCALIVVLSIVAPKYLLARTLTEQTNHVEVAPEEYYLEAGTMMSRNTSSNLSAVDRIKLISGTWDSNMTKCDITEGFLDEVEAVELAKKQLDAYYIRIPCRYSMTICIHIRQNFTATRTPALIPIRHISGRSHLRSMITAWRISFI